MFLGMSKSWFHPRPARTPSHAHRAHRSCAEASRHVLSPSCCHYLPSIPPAVRSSRTSRFACSHPCQSRRTIPTHLLVPGAVPRSDNDESAVQPMVPLASTIFACTRPRSKSTGNHSRARLRRTFWIRSFVATIFQLAVDAIAKRTGRRVCELLGRLEAPSSSSRVLSAVYIDSLLTGMMHAVTKARL